ncbi:very short patch repair endonuclease [Burkholderia multivorans]|uniref:very short patch repair endonuclease n=1 Tax=Burkholderia multivorans TaxID=87883 RepID=UPI001C6164D5|nr:very short patch repair endonuclease [Burkholderia multivorans]
MVDVVDKETRRRMMSGIRAKNTKPEMLVRKVLFAAGYRFRLHRRDLPGVPDVVLPSHKVAIFVHGCFWHRHAGCGFATSPTTNAAFWHAKLSGNVERDTRAIEALKEAGWRVLVVWECATKGKSAEAVEDLARVLSEWIEGDAPFGEIPEILPH